MFSQLKALVQKRFNEMLSTNSVLFYIDINRDEIWERYLNGFADPVERQGHNCNCCKSFLRQYAGIVTIVQNKIHTIWDVEADEVFAPSVKNLRDYILSLPVTDVFLNPFAKLGTDKNVDSKNPAVVWQHFFLTLPRNFVKSETSIPSIQAEMRDTKAVFKRGLDEISQDAINTVLELISQNSLYRGKEFEKIVATFGNVKELYVKVPSKLKDNFCWAAVTQIAPPPIAKIRNTSIGTLLINLSEGMDLDAAVTKYEAVVAPTNYKRPTSLVTPRMVEQAKQHLQELGYLESLERRFAVETDLNINDVLFVDKTTTLTDVFEDMKKDTEVNPKSLTKVEEVTVQQFISSVLPTAKGISVLLENSHLPNMVSLLTAKNGSPSIFKWLNQFSWAYTGGITDSIKERVKQAGGNVDGELRVSLSWHNHDDLDLHVLEPDGHRIYFSDKVSRTGGNLDVDMNAGSGKTRNAVENIVWPDARSMRVGRYQVIVHNYARREATGIGFEVQVECRGEVFDFEFNKNPMNERYQTIVEFDYTQAKGLVMVGDVKSNIVSKEKWNLKTNRFHKVKQIMLSPNCWDKEVGNKHFFFTLENCASDESTRPFFNEFLKEELTPHRKFFEVLGSKLLVSPATNQLAGVGFSETQRNHVYARVEGAFNRIIKINF